MKIEMKFPCGYEVKIVTGFLDSLNLSGEIIGTTCPIHGRKCSIFPELAELSKLDKKGKKRVQRGKKG